MRAGKTAAVLTCLLLVASSGSARPVVAGEEKEQEKLVDCRMTFTLKGWSAFYKTSSGEGTIKCDNGETAKVTLRATGGGITFGKSEMLDGIGKFSGARGIAELLGSYVQSEANAGAGKSAGAQALTKGEVSLVLSGTGRGVELGFAFGKFTIEGAR